MTLIGDIGDTIGDASTPFDRAEDELCGWLKTCRHGSGCECSACSTARKAIAVLRAPRGDAAPAAPETQRVDADNIRAQARTEAPATSCRGCNHERHPSLACGECERAGHVCTGLATHRSVRTAPAAQAGLPPDIAEAVNEALGEGDEIEEATCRRCGEPYSIDDGCDPTPLCHHCAQDVASMLAWHIRESDGAGGASA